MLMGFKRLLQLGASREEQLDLAVLKYTIREVCGFSNTKSLGERIRIQNYKSPWMVDIIKSKVTDLVESKNLHALLSCGIQQ